VYRTILCAAAGAIIFAMPAKATEVEPVRMPDGIYVLNLASSIVISGTTPPAQLVKIEKDKSTVLGFNDRIPGGVSNYVLNRDGAIDGKPHPITGIPTWDSTTVTQLDPFTFSEGRSKDGEPIPKIITVANPKGNTFTVSLVGSLGTALLIYEKQ
jgi:hypothetical protein